MSEEQKLIYIDTMISKTARAMRKQMTLPKNMKKELWFSMNDFAVFRRINEELKELHDVIYYLVVEENKDLSEKIKMDKEFKRKKIIEEAADICNFLGMLIDNQGGEI